MTSFPSQGDPDQNQNISPSPKTPVQWCRNRMSLLMARAMQCLGIICHRNKIIPLFNAPCLTWETPMYSWSISAVYLAAYTDKYGEVIMTVNLKC